MKYVINYRHLYPEMVSYFNLPEEADGNWELRIRELTDSQVIEAIKKFGRASISPFSSIENMFELYFQNDYD